MIQRPTLQRYLARVLGCPVKVLALRPLRGAPVEGSDPKAFGYGGPLEVECLVGGEPKAFVITRLRPKEGFGHDYPADRAWAALWGHPAYNRLPRHVRSLDVGFVRRDGNLVSAADAAGFFQVVERAGGTPYWVDLDRLRGEPPTPADWDRVDVLAAYLADLHAEKRSAPALYQRRIRELVGHGECLMGILDSYPHPYPLLPPERCEALERAAVAWRWRLRNRGHRLSRVHGDFHPWNILFREGSDFSLLDRSRGEWGEPADDVAALAINYLFFGLLRGPGLAEPFRAFFRRFFAAYLAASRDAEVLDVAPPYFMWRALVVAHPRWYPAIPERVRVALLTFAGTMGAPAPLDPEAVERSVEGDPAAVGPGEG